MPLQQFTKTELRKLREEDSLNKSSSASKPLVLSDETKQRLKLMQQKHKAIFASQLERVGKLCKRAIQAVESLLLSFRNGPSPHLPLAAGRYCPGKLCGGSTVKQPWEYNFALRFLPKCNNPS